MIYQPVDQCRACGAELGAALLDIGIAPVGDALSQRASDHRYQAPLALHRCPACELLQLGCHLAPAAIFNERYPYYSSTIGSLVARMRGLAGDLSHRYALGAHSSVIEIASNDGYLLRHFKALGVAVLGVEPASGQVARAQRQGIDTCCAFFGSELAREIREKRGAADLVIANNVVAHVPEVNDFIAGIGYLLSDEGAAVFEFHHAARMLEACQFDTLYHQHIFYFTLATFARLLSQHGLHVQSVEQIEAYGGSLRVHAGKRRQGDVTVRALLQKEAAMSSQQALTHFVRCSVEKSDAIRQMVCDFKAHGRRIVGYGAAAKASTLLAICTLDERQLDYLVDQNPHKHGLYMPGSALKIYPVEKLAQDPPDYLLILAWNYAGEIMQQLDWFKDRGGRFIIPSPDLEIV